MAAGGRTAIKLKDHQLFSKVKELVPEWEVLGIFLEIPREKLRAIEASTNNKPIERKFIDMLEKFMMEEEDDCTWLNVCEALKSMGNVRLARKLKEKYGEGQIEQELPEVQSALQECLPDWSTFGLMLGINKTDIDTIDARDPYSRYLSEVLHLWRNKSEEPTWEVLIEAIKNVGNRRLGNELSKEFLKN